MKTTRSEDGSGYYIINPLQPNIEITCPMCGFDIDLWTDENVTECELCGYRPFNHERMIN
jgi:DNA-directed RNA polymerase subunit RPC12/RpoP